MLFNNSTGGDPRSFFYYKGDYYINGTEITLKDEYINTHSWNGKKLLKNARYDHQTTYNGQISYFFSAGSRFDWYSTEKIGNDYAPYFVVSAMELENAIEEVTHPIKLPREQTEAILNNIATPKSELEDPKVIVSWLIYIAVLVGSLIFKQFYIIWIIATVLFFKYKKGLKQ